MTEHDLTLRRPLVLVVAAFVGLACALLGGAPGGVAAVWNAIVLAMAWRKATRRTTSPGSPGSFGPLGSPGALGPFGPLGALGPLGTLGSFALAAIYALAARAAFGGSDPEDVDRVASLQLGAVATGCAIVGITSAALWLVRGARER